MDLGWQNIVDEELDKLKSHRKDLVTDMWKHNRISLNENDTPSCEWKSWKMNDKKENGKLIAISAFISGKRNVTQKVRANQFPSVTTTPRMKMWVPILRNFMVPDAIELSHVPYISDDVNDVFVVDLIKSYDGKLHGGKNENVMDDDMFVDLVKALIPYQNNANENASSTFESIPTIIFEKILPHFPPATNVVQLCSKYEHLTAKRPQCKPNIDDANAMTRVLTREESLSSYRQYICRRCYTYNCELHGIENNNPKPINQPQIRFEEPCGDVCYKHMMDSVSDETSFENTSEARNNNQNTSVEDIKWSAVEETMFLALYNVFPNNCCAIAAAIVTKSCEQVYEYFKITDLKPVNEAVVKKINKLPKTRSFAKEHASKMYKACNHEGDCNDKNVDCSCINCEKYCNCRQDCKKKFRTCSCNKQCTTNHCFCFNAHRECDPDLCKCCTLDNSCKNVAIQQGLHKNVKIAPSDVHGWGLFMHEICKKDELIGEYRGEIISKKEADRRGKVYDKIDHTYIFQLNDEYDVDATRFGSNVRFINFSKNPNCEAKVMMVNGDHRIGIYANRMIEEGEELFLDYQTVDPTKVENRVEQKM